MVHRCVRLVSARGEFQEEFDYQLVLHCDKIRIFLDPNKVRISFINARLATALDRTSLLTSKFSKGRKHGVFTSTETMKAY